MAEQQYVLANNDWIVHRQYGIGQVRGREVKQISGEPEPYYRLELANGTVWVPVNKVDNEMFRPVATEQELQMVYEILQRPARKMEGNFKLRHQRIKKVEMGDSLLELARLVRDLWSRHWGSMLSNTEQTALRRVTDRLVTEWSVCVQKDADDVRARLDDMLRSTRSQLPN